MTLLLMLAALAPEVSGDPPSALNLDKVEARLFYKGSGRLSDDLLSRNPPFTGWNTIIGEGEAEELADDMIVTARLSSFDGQQKIVDGPVLLIVRDGTGKVIAQRQWQDVLTDRGGSAVVPLWVPDIGCAGDLSISASYNGSTQSGKVSFECGE